MAETVRLVASLRFKFALGLVLFSAGLMLGVLILLEQSFSASLIRENIDKGLGIARGIALNSEDPLLTGDDIALFSAVKNAVLSRGIVYALILDRTDHIRAAADTSRVGQVFQPADDATLVESSDGILVTRSAGARYPLLDLEVPIFSLAEQPIRLGKIHLGLSEELIEQDIRSMRLRLVVMSLFGLLFGGGIAYLLAGMAVRPVHALVQGVTAVGRGDLSRHIALQRKDELGILTDAFNAMTSSLREKEYIKHTFERYVSKALAQQILTHKDELKLGGEEKDITILFCDIRAFTPLSENLSAPEVVDLLNMYFSEIVEVIGDHDGMVDKFMGDAVMVLFGAPLAVGDEPAKAIRCALDIQRTVSRINQTLAQQGRPPLEIGVGINSGTVIAGNIGSQHRMEYTVIGDNVNLASRLEGLNKVYGTNIIVSAGTRHAIQGEFGFRELDLVQVQGRRQPVAIFEVLTEEGELHRLFAEGLQLYRTRNFSAALAIFEATATRFADQPSRIFSERCREYLNHPPAPDWHGIFTALRK